MIPVEITMDSHRKRKHDQPKTNQPKLSPMKKGNAFDSPVEPSLNLESPTPKTKHQRPMFPCNTALVSAAETSAQGRHRTQRMAHTLQTNAEGTSLKHIDISSCHDVDIPQ